MSPRPKLLTPQGNLQQAIIEIAWKQIAESGAASLSLRAIARELKITAPAIYNYFPSRDDLVTALILYAYQDFGNAQLAAVQAVPETDLTGRLAAAGRAYRAWALAYPERYHLIFGTPIPGYVAPEETTQPVAERSMSALVSVLEALRSQNKLGGIPDIEHADTGDSGQHVMMLATLIWARVHGLVSLEISHNLPPLGPSPETLYEYELGAILRNFVR
jgi:AcrR family transcriptional regulator